MIWSLVHWEREQQSYQLFRSQIISVYSLNKITILFIVLNGVYCVIKLKKCVASFVCLYVHRRDL